MEVKKDLTYCTLCPHLVMKSNFNRDSDTCNFTWYCTAAKEGNQNQRYISGPTSFQNASAQIVRPFWCPKMTEETEKKEEAKPSTVSSVKPARGTFDWFKKWDDIPPLIKWEDVKANHVYHIPPIKGNPRMDIYITSKYVGMAYFKVLTKDNVKLTHNVFEFMYPSSTMARRMVESKVMKFEIPTYAY